MLLWVKQWYLFWVHSDLHVEQNTCFLLILTFWPCSLSSFKVAIDAGILGKNGTRPFGVLAVILKCPVKDGPIFEGRVSGLI